MIGTDKAQPTGQRLPKIMPITVRIGAPLDFSRYQGMEGDRFVLRSITDEIMYELLELSGQEYVDIYASAAKKRFGSVRAKTARVTELGASAQPETPQPKTSPTDPPAMPKAS